MNEEILKLRICGRLVDSLNGRMIVRNRPSDIQSHPHRRHHHLHLNRQSSRDAHKILDPTSFPHNDRHLIWIHRSRDRHGSRHLRSDHRHGNRRLRPRVWTLRPLIRVYHPHLRNVNRRDHHLGDHENALSIFQRATLSPTILDRSSCRKQIRLHPCWRIRWTRNREGLKEKKFNCLMSFESNLLTMCDPDGVKLAESREFFLQLLFLYFVG